MIELQYNVFLNVIKNINKISNVSVIKNYTFKNETNVSLKEVSKNNIKEVTFILENNLEKLNNILKLLDDFENVIIDKFDDLILINFY